MSDHNNKTQQFFLKFYNNKSRTIEYDQNEKIGDIIERIGQSEGLLSYRINLLQGGIYLDKNESAGSYHLKDRTLDLLLCK